MQTPTQEQIRALETIFEKCVHLAGQSPNIAAILGIGTKELEKARRAVEISKNE